MVVEVAATTFAVASLEDVVQVPLRSVVPPKARPANIQWDILSDIEHRRRIRRVGNSNMVALPSEYEAAGFGPGVEVLVEETPGGELRIVRADAANESTREAARRLANRHRGTLDHLEEHDRRG